MISRGTEICAAAAQMAGWALLMLLGDVGAVLSNPYLRVVGGAGLVLVLASSLQMMVQLIFRPKGQDPYKILVRGGIYRYVRHPIYTGVLIMSLTVLIASPTHLVGLAFLLTALVTIVRAALEEAILEQRIPEYSEYRAHTKRFIPFVI